MKNILIVASHEGASGYDAIGRNFSASTSRELAEDINAVSRAIKEQGFGVYSFYKKTKEDPATFSWYGNYLEEGITPVRKEEVKGLLGAIDGVILLGLSAKAGTQNAFLDHTLYDYAIFDYKIDGQRKGALGICKTFFDANGIPVLMSSGCLAACNEAKEEGITECVITKTAKEGWRNGANVRDKEEVHEELYATAKRVLVNAKRFEKTSKTVLVEIEFIREDFLENFAYKNKTFERVNARTLKKTVKIDDEIGEFLV